MTLLHILSIVSITAMSGCTSIQHVSVDKHEISTFSVKELTVVRRPVPDFQVITRGNAAASAVVPLIGSAIVQGQAKSFGQSIALAAGLSDPSSQIAESLAVSLEKAYGIKYSGIANETVDEDASVFSRAVTYRDFPLILDVKTIVWGITYLSVFADEYRFAYAGHLQVVATESSKVLAEGSCLASKSQQPLFPYEQLLENGAAKLKDQMQKVVQFCIKEFSGKYLGM